MTTYKDYFQGYEVKLLMCGWEKTDNKCYVPTGYSQFVTTCSYYLILSQRKQIPHNGVSNIYMFYSLLGKTRRLVMIYLSDLLHITGDVYSN